MTDNEIGDAMRQLPRATASPRFASDVLRAVRAHRRPRAVLRFAAATALVVMVVASMYGLALRQRQQRLESLRVERQRIESELQRVKVMADESRPVVVLENGDTQLIVNHEDPHRKPQLFYY